MDKEFMGLAIIDDGINEGLYNIFPIGKNIEIMPQLQVCKRKGYNPYLPSHGTICAAIIKKYLPQMLPLTSIKILNNKSKCIKEQLVKSIEWCIDNGIRLINLSLGTVDYRDFEPIRRVVNDAYERGVIIVAAYSNEDIITYPASLSNVIGVKCDRKNSLIQDEYLYDTFSNDGIEIIASGSYILKDSRGKEYITPPSNSYATPFITALVYNIMSKVPDITLEEIKKELRLNSKNYMDKKQEWNEYIYKNIDWVNKAAVFTLGKTSIIFDHNLFFFDVTNSIEVNYNNVDDCLSYVKDYIEQIGISANTIILINEKNNQCLKEEAMWFIEDMRKHKKNVIFIDDFEEGYNLNIKPSYLKSKLWYPSIYRNFNFNNNQGFELEIPSIIIYDFEGRELLYFLSLLLNLFKNDGYYAVTAVNTYKGMLMGHKPIGLQETIKENKKIFFSKIHDLYNLYKPDIIIIGINNEPQNNNLYKWIAKTTEPDIFIFITNKFKKDLENIKEIDNLKSEVIVSSKNTCVDYKRGKIFNSLDENYLEKIYQYIISLFNNN